MPVVSNKRQNDTNIIMNSILKSNGITRTEIHLATGIRPATITDIVRQLIEQGFVNEGGGQDKKKLLKINKQCVTVIGADVEPDRVLVLVADVVGNVLHRAEQPICASAMPEEVLGVLCNLLDEAIALEVCKNLKGIGVAVTGFINTEKKIVLSSSQFYNFSNVPLGDILRKRYNLPIVVDDCASFKLIGEQKFSSLVACKDIIYVEIGHGVGTAILSNGSLIKGHLGLAGELGHSVVNPQGTLCMCGNRGCLRTVATSAEIVKRVVEIMQSNIYTSINSMVDGNLDAVDIHTVMKAAEQNDKIAINVTDETAMYIGIALANAINMLNPKAVIFGGQMFSQSHYMLEPIMRVMIKNALPMFASDIICKVADFVDDGGAMGACAVAIDYYFQYLFPQ